MPEALAILAAVVAGAFALFAARTTAANQRIIELEKRLATSRFDTYKPILEVMAVYMTPGEVSPQANRRRNERFLEATQNFAIWGLVYTSDGSVQTFHRMMQAAYHDAPPVVMLRLYGEFLLAARRDLGDRATKLGLVDVLGVRIKDLYEGMADDMRLADAPFYRKVGWTPPWPRA